MICQKEEWRLKPFLKSGTYLKVIAAAASLFVLTGCSSTNTRIEIGTMPPDSPDGGVSIHTVATTPENTDTLPAVQTDAASGQPQSEPVSSSTEPVTVQAEPSGTVSSAEEAFEPQTGFLLPEEFFVRLEEIFERYQINQNCDPTQSPCGCTPEYEQVDEDGNIVTPRDRVVSIYFLDADSGYELEINSGVHFPIASTVKIPFCTLIYQKLTDELIDPDTILTYEKRHYFGGTGVIVKGDYGQQFTVTELLKLAITESDNVAYEMLKDLVSWEEFGEFLAANGCTHPEDLRSRQQKICTESAGAYGRILMDFLTGDSPYVEDFKADLKITKNKMIKSHYPFYRKYGWTQFAFHDIAYVDAPHPYVLAILTNLEGEDNSDYEMYKEISYLFEEYSQSDANREAMYEQSKN